MTKHHTRPSDSRSPFLAACSEWLRAKAAIAELNAGSKATDKVVSAAIDAVAAVEWKIMRTPAANLAEIRERAQIVLELFAREDEIGEPTDNRNRLMLAALVSEICSPIPEGDTEPQHAAM